MKNADKNAGIDVGQFPTIHFLMGRDAIAGKCQSGMTPALVERG
jgi:hypothetical protein